jgi:hypothetical protein
MFTVALRRRRGVAFFCLAGRSNRGWRVLRARMFSRDRNTASHQEDGNRKRRKRERDWPLERIREIGKLHRPATPHRYIFTAH